MKNLILSALISTALFSNMAFAETYFECTSIYSDGRKFSLQDSEKGKDFLTYQVTNKHGEHDQFDLLKSDVDFGADNWQDDDGQIYYTQYVQFTSDKAYHEMHYNKFSDIFEHVYVIEILFGEEDIEDKGFYNCDMKKPVIHSIDKLK